MYVYEAVKVISEVYKCDIGRAKDILHNKFMAYAMFRLLIENVSLFKPTEKNVVEIEKLLNEKTLVVTNKNDILIKRICETKNIDFVTTSCFSITDNLDKYDSIMFFETINLIDCFTNVINWFKESSINHIVALIESEKEKIKNIGDFDIELINLDKWNEDVHLVKFSKKG